MIYRIFYTPKAELDFLRLAKNEPKAYKKACEYIEELKLHPTTGLGHPEPLKGKPEVSQIIFFREISPFRAIRIRSAGEGIGLFEAVEIA